jgi:hypothetical protein
MFYEFPYLKITKELLKTVGPADEETRIFRQSGNHMDFICWVNDLREVLKGNVMPATWVPTYVGVSRAAVHKRIKSGRLTMFVFEHVELELNLRFKHVERKKGEFAYCVRTECEAWFDEIRRREAQRIRPELR